MDSMDTLLTSLQGGIRRYQGPSLADDIMRFIADNSHHRDVLRQHSVDLATTRENEFKVISSEAQRCRAELARKDAPETEQPKPVVRRRKR
jgi:predicted metal-dependent hydrolase